LSRLLLAMALGAGIFAPFGPFGPLGSLAPSASEAATDNQLAVNVTTGLAISGFDPVACFTEGKALFGRPEFELNLDGAVWRFINEGNRGAFAKNPEVYGPRFGGYDSVAIGRGRSVQAPDLGGRRATALTTASRRVLLSSPIRAALLTLLSANGPRSPGT
jgi:hypothetical protein